LTATPGALRVVGWSTGAVGRISIRAIARRPDLDLVGVWVHSDDKVGTDAGTLADTSPLGVAATNDVDALFALEPDCVVYSASGASLDPIADYELILAAGIDVVTVSVAGLVYPKGFATAARDRLDAAAQRGGATLYASGIEPGFAGDQLPLVLSTLSNTIESIRIQEIFSYAEYPVTFMMFDVFGFGKPPDYAAPLASDGAQLGTWGPPVEMIADRLGVQLDGLRETTETALTDRRLEVAAGTIEPGTVAGLRFETIGVVDGRDAIVIEHVNRMAPDIAPHWPTAGRDGTYRIVIEGDPRLECELTVGAEATCSADGMVATTMRLVNAIPYVCEAPPGLVSSLDLPLTTPLHALR
jgi:hypothetical protein